MGYQLVVWEGQRPEDDAACERACQDIARRYFVREPVEPTPAIREFVEALTEQWTDDPEDPGWQDTPWTYPPILAGASGSALHLERGLVALDPQLELLLPVSDEVIAEFARRRAGLLN